MPTASRVLRAWLVFLAILLVGHAAIEAAGPRYEERINVLTAATLDCVLSALGADARRVGDTVTVSSASNAFAMQIIRECTAESPLILLAAAIFAYPCTRRDRAVGLVFGAVTIVALNALRLASLSWIGLSRPDLFEVAHVVVWQSLMVLAVIGLWLLWARLWVDRHARQTA